MITKVAKNPSILLIGAYPDENGQKRTSVHCVIFEPVHRSAFLTIFVRISMDKENTWIFVNFSDQLDEILEDSCDFWRFLEIFGLKVWNFST